jgi:hypothetical protein
VHCLFPLADPPLRCLQLHPVVPPQVSHSRQVPLRTMVKLQDSRQASPT